MNRSESPLTWGGQRAANGTEETLQARLTGWTNFFNWQVMLNFDWHCTRAFPPAPPAAGTRNMATPRLTQAALDFGA